MRRSIALTLVLLLLHGLFADEAQAQPTTSAAATRPVVVDLSTPRAAAKTLFLAIRAKDLAAVSATLDAPDRESEIIGAMAELLVASSRMSEAGTKRFGKTGDPLGRPALTPNDVGAAEQAKVNEDGDSATVQIPGQARPMNFRRRGGQWRLAADALTGGDAANVPPQQLKLIRNMAIAMNELARDIENGKYQTSSEAERYVQEKLHAVMIEMFKPQRGPTTQATTRP